jgi:hypothetical protein
MNMRINAKTNFVIFTFCLAASAHLQAAPLEKMPPVVERHDRFREVSPSDIKTDGWLREFMIRQEKGLTGHYEVQGYPFTIDFWAGDKNVWYLNQAVLHPSFDGLCEK